MVIEKRRCYLQEGEKMKKIIVMDRQECSMERWISVIVGNALQMKLYEEKNLAALADEAYLDSDFFSKKKCSAILVEVVKDRSLDHNECQRMIRQSFTWLC